jgi:hypothetical protein
MRHVPYLVIAMACSHPTAPVANHASMKSAPNRPACPADARVLVQGWRLEDATDLRVECAGGFFGQPGWFLQATYEADAETYGASGIVATDGRTELVRHNAEAISWSDHYDLSARYQAVDLNGDGVDELVKLEDDTHHGYQTLSASVLYVRDGKLAEIDGPLVSYDDSAVQLQPGSVNACEGAVTVHGRDIVIIVRARRGRPDGCLALGKHVFELRGDKLVEMSSVRRPNAAPTRDY